MWENYYVPMDKNVVNKVEIVPDIKEDKVTKERINNNNNRQVNTAINNNNNISLEYSMAEQELLKKLEEANR